MTDRARADETASRLAGADEEVPQALTLPERVLAFVAANVFPPADGCEWST